MIMILKSYHISKRLSSESKRIFEKFFLGAAIVFPDPAQYAAKRREMRNG